MPVLVTGGAGYIGSVVTEELINNGHEVVVYDNLENGHRAAVHARAKLVTGDLLDGETLGRTIRGNAIEAVVHMAAYALVGESVAQPEKYYRNNVLGGVTLLSVMRDNGIKRIVFSSSAAVYGEPAKQPVEEGDPTNPTNPYGENKLAFERALAWDDEVYDLRYASLRYFNAAGATERCGESHATETHLIPLILQAASGKRPHIEIHGGDYPTRDGTCVRDYIHVVDLARAHIMALEGLEQKSRTYNLGCGGEGYTVSEVIDMTREVTGKDFEVKVGPRRPGDPAVLVASSEKIKRELGWKPSQQDLRLIIKSAWDWMNAHPEGYET
ncbi:MAG: UDP-glucose 4-epimerase [Blastocatellia bacterium]|jgi:UDP-glucose 4-epimerase|nr:UDP-glucose 4-epimerase [Blastocatellia bacterium]